MRLLDCSHTCLIKPTTRPEICRRSSDSVRALMQHGKTSPQQERMHRIVTTYLTESCITLQTDITELITTGSLVDSNWFLEAQHRHNIVWPTWQLHLQNRHPLDKWSNNAPAHFNSHGLFLKHVNEGKEFVLKIHRWPWTEHSSKSEYCTIAKTVEKSCMCDNTFTMTDCSCG